MFPRWTDLQWPLLISFMAAACVYMLFLEPWGHDTWFHLQRLLDVRDQVAAGQQRLVFAENAAQGKGIPVWIYYSQWIYWPALFLTWLGLSPLLALKFIYATFLAVCCVGCYRLLRLHAGEELATFGTLLFMTANYVIGEVLIRSAYAEFLSVAWLPWLLLMLHRSTIADGIGPRASVALLTALMVLAHPLSFMNSGIAVASYAGFLAVSQRAAWPRLLAVVPWFALGLALSAFFWLPAVIETRYVMGAEGVPTPLSATFLSPLSFINFSGIRNLGFVLTGVLPLLAYHLWRWRNQRDMPRGVRSWPLVAGTMAYALLTLRISAPLYETVPMLASNLWVWRVFFQMTLLAVVFIVVNFSALPARLRADRWMILAGAVGVLQAAAVVAWNSAEHLSTRALALSEIEAEVARERTVSQGFGIDEYLPQLRHLTGPTDPCADVVTVALQDPRRIQFPVDTAVAGRCLHIPRYWNVRYVASVDGEPIPVYGDARGEILLVPGDRSGVLVLELGRPPYVTAATAVSVVALGLLLVGLVRRWR